MECFLDYFEEQCQPTHAYYYRIAKKQGRLWNVKDYYVKEKTLYRFSRYADDSLKIREGMFSTYHPNGVLAGKIRYVNDKKEGLERRYDSSGVLTDSCWYLHGIPSNVHMIWYSNGKLEFKGLYDKQGSGAGEEWSYFDNGVLSGYGRMAEGCLEDSVHTFYYRNGKVRSRYLYNKGEVLHAEGYDSLGNLHHLDCDPITMPEFLEYNGDFFEYLTQNFSYPRDYRLTDEGYVLTEFVVDIEGYVEDVAILKGLHPEIDKRVKHVLENAPRWSPGVYRNLPIRVVKTLPFVFAEQPW